MNYIRVVKIYACILLLAFGFSYLQPAFCYVSSDDIALECGAEIECSMPADCTMPPGDVPADEEQPEKKGCMLLVCSNCTFIFVERPSMALQRAFEPKQKLFTSNDNRIITTSSDVWHPPERLLII